MKTLLAIALALTAGCASSDYAGIKTGSRFYDAKLASESGLNQSETSKCEQEGRALFRELQTNRASESGAAEAGHAYENCVKRLARK